jgi:PTS system mannose-specific IIA component
MLVVTHGRLAEELVHAARTIVGSVDGLEALSIDWKEEIDSIQARLSRAIESLDRGGGVIVATDMFGGTPTNLALALHERGRIEIVTGVNLPMLIRFAGLGERLGLVEAAGRIAREGREAIHVASDVLDSQPPAGESRP